MRQRRMRSWFRHEQQSIRMALATVLHHSYDRVHTEYGAPRSQNTVTRATGGGESYETKYTATIRKTPPPQAFFQLYDEEDAERGVRPASLAEAQGPQERVQLRTVEHIADVVPMVQILDILVPQKENQLVEVCRQLDILIPEQDIELPKISSSSRGDLPSNSLETHCIVITVVTIHTVEQVSQTTTTTGSNRYAAGSAKRRRERRLRQFLRHERCSWPRRTTTPPHGDRRWPGAGGGFEVHYTAKFRKHPPPRSPARSTSFSTTIASRSSGARGRTGCLPCLGRRSKSRGASWSRSSTQHPSSRFSTLLSRSWWTPWWNCGRSSTTCCLTSSRSSKCPRFFLTRSRSAPLSVAVFVIEHVRVAPGSDAWGFGFMRISESAHLVGVYDTGWRDAAKPGRFSNTGHRSGSGG